MKKSVVRNLSLANLVLAIIGVGAFIASAISAAQTSTTSTTAAASPSLTTSGPMLIGSLFFLVAIVCGLIAWIGGLIATAKIQRWGWFVAVLLLGSLGALIWGIGGPTEASTPQMPPTYPAQR